MAKEKILVIDDEKEFLSLLESRLGAEGYEVITASNGIEGLERVREQKPDLVVCDIGMPLKDGFEVLKEIREGVDKRLPVIIASVVDDFDKITKVYEDEADFFVSKPVEIITLSKNIRTLLNLCKGKRE
ncbi:MAG: response regulator [Candidatus Omnitrophica bacterium]|nr:response regulator [Candidatus Omnitrophota bacterium]